MKHYVHMLLGSLLLLILSGCVTGVVSPEVSGTAKADPTQESMENGRGTLGSIASLAGSRTPMPTATPSAVDQSIYQLSERTGMDGFLFLGLTGQDWINVLISILIFLIGYWIVTKLFLSLLLRAARRTKTKFDDEFLRTVGPELKNFIALLLLRYAVLRLDFLESPIKTIFNDVIFILGLILGMIICFKLVNFTVNWASQNLESKDGQRDEHLDPLLALMQHASYILIIITGALIGLDQFGVDINIFIGILIIIGLGIVIGARTILEDLVGGFIILLNQPIRVGDAIKVEGWPDWGYVVEVGSRTTHLRTLDNRTIIIPNSTISSSRIINYSTRENTILVRTHVRIGYQDNLDQVRRLLTQTLRGIDGVLPEKPVEIHFKEFGDSTRIIQVRWWIHDYGRKVYIVDTVNSAIEQSLIEAGIKIPYSILNLNLNQLQTPPLTHPADQTQTSNEESNDIQSD